MTDNYLQIRALDFFGLSRTSSLSFVSGVNVVCGASDTGKSFLAEAIDYMLGGSKLREIKAAAGYSEIKLGLVLSGGEECALTRSMSGGAFHLVSSVNGSETLKADHVHGKTDNLSGFLLSKLGLNGRIILKSKTKSTTQSLSFRNVAPLAIVQEEEIYKKGSPFWGGQYVTKTAEIATVKLLLTGNDDSSVVPSNGALPDNTQKISLLDELVAELGNEAQGRGLAKSDIEGRLGDLDESITRQRTLIDATKADLDELLQNRRNALGECSELQDRLDEIAELSIRFDLLDNHYDVDVDRLRAIRESGSLFSHVKIASCPMCGAAPESQHIQQSCAGDVESLVAAASAEVEKIERLKRELRDTVADLRIEREELSGRLTQSTSIVGSLNRRIQEVATPRVDEALASFASSVEARAAVQNASDLYSRMEKLEIRRLRLLESGATQNAGDAVEGNLPDTASHALSLRISKILRAWNFPGECQVYYDTKTTDFVIDGQPRGSRGKGLRAITHAAVTIALLEHCQENGMPHPGFVVLDSPLLAYFKPEGDDDLQLKGTDLKERFYEYLVAHHGEKSQVIVIENLHPPKELAGRLAMTVFTGNPGEGRAGLLT